MTNLIGQSLGRYHILEQLGEGGMAKVYKAHDTRLDCDVAIKIIRIERMVPEIASRALTRFEREAHSLAQLTHPNIVKVTDYGEFEGQPYLVMEYLSGGTLKNKLGKPLPFQVAAHLLAPIARALEFAHQRSIVHRDIKPANILLTESGQPMLSDFGIAKMLEIDETVDLTGTSATLGTPEYMAPEQVTSKTIDHRADIYSLGVVFFEMLTGRKPFEGDTPMSILFKHASEPLPRPRSIVPGLPKEVEAVLLIALAKKPIERYQAMGDFAIALEKIAGQVTSKSSNSIRNNIVPKDQEQEILSKSALPNTILIMLALFFLGLGLSIGYALMQLGEKGAGPFSELATHTPLPTFTITPSPRPTLTSTSTPIPLPTEMGGGGLIVFASEQGGDSEIYLIGSDGSGLTPLTSNSQSDSEPSLSPDRKKIAFCSDRDGDNEIYVMNMDGSGVAQITNNDKWDCSPSWSPDGNQIAFSSDRDGDSEIYIMNSDGSQVTQITENSWYDYDPDWSPDGKQVVFSAYPGNQCGEIFIANANGSSLLQLTDNSKCDYSPSWSPDGKRIAFSSDRDGDSEIYIMSSDGKEVVQITNNEKNQGDRNPDWSPDGQHIIFESNRDGDDDVYIMDITGKGIVQLTQNSWDDASPCWE